MQPKKKVLDTTALCRILCKWHVAAEYEALAAELRSRPELEGFKGCVELVAIMVTEARVSPEDGINFLNQTDLDIHQALTLAHKKRKKPQVQDKEAEEQDEENCDDDDPKGKKKRHS